MSNVFNYGCSQSCHVVLVMSFTHLTVYQHCGQSLMDEYSVDCGVKKPWRIGYVDYILIMLQDVLHLHF